VRQDHEAAAQGVARWEVMAVRCLAEAIDTRRARQGWRLNATNLPSERMELGACVRSYRGGWCLERDFRRRPRWGSARGSYVAMTSSWA
jgi:hypothetical protein